jgi:hypothetical protein
MSNYTRVLGIDFAQIFSPYPDNQRIIPNNTNQGILGDFRDLVAKLDSSFESAYKENPLPKVFFNLITDKVYEKEELHGEGKIMTDEQLAAILSTLTINDHSNEIIDPGNGDGALLDAAYDYILRISEIKNIEKSHNQILKQLHGCEVDSFLNQLATFRLLSKNLPSVNNETEIDLISDDVFKRPRKEEFDVVLMNPPYLRNDDPKYPITEVRKNIMLRAIEEVTRNTSFIRQARQPNLYFYFVNWVLHYLKQDGRAGIILMSKFMNNQDGKYLKDYMRPYIHAVITYPRDYFSEFQVTTCIVILEKVPSNNHVNFIKILDQELIDDPRKIKDILELSHDEVNANYTVKRISREELDPQENWLPYILDPKDNFKKLNSIGILKCLKGSLYNVIKRGSAESSGGSKEIFLRDSSPIASCFNQIEPQYVGLALQNSTTIRHHLLKENELDKAILFPANYKDIKNNINNYPPGFTTFFKRADQHYNSWNKIVNNVYNSKVKPNILIPRGSRVKHAVYINNRKELVLSTNFIYCSNPNNGETDIVVYDTIVAAYLQSSFGQIQFELNANNQEGMRKLEEFMIYKIKAIDPQKLTNEERNTIIETFNFYNSQNVQVTGKEGINTPRRGLDNAIAQIIFNYDHLGFDSTEALVNHVELFLEELTVERSS